MSLAYLSLGSNLGDRLEHLKRGVAGLHEMPGVRVTRLSAVYETEPVGVSGQNRYLNLVAQLETSLSPHDLLKACQAVESANGRVRTVRWGPRTLDIDLLLYDGITMQTPELEIPHPRMHERAFVLVPLSTLDETIIVRGRPVREWLEHVQRTGEQGIELYCGTEGWISDDR